MTLRTPLLAQLALLLPLTLTLEAAAAGDPGPGPTPTPTPTNPWESSVVPPSAVNLDIGAFASTAKRQTTCFNGFLGYPCTLIGIAYQNKTNGDVMYSYTTDGGQTFTHSTVDFGEDGDVVGNHVSLAFAGTTPVISYQNVTDGTLWFARRVSSGGNCGTNSNWKCKNLGSGGLHSSIATDDNNRVVIAHSRSGGGVHLAIGLPPYDDFTPQTVVSTSVRSLKVDIDDIHQIHLAWATLRCVYYTYAFYEQIETVECSPTGTLPVEDAGRISMIVNSGERPHLAYTLNSSTGSYRVRHAFKTTIDAWTRESVATVTSIQPATSLILASNGLDTEAISYGTGGASPSLKVATKNTGIINLLWSSYTADIPGGAYSSMTRLGSRLVVLHHDDVGNDLRFTIHD